MRATRVGRDTALARIVDLVQRAQGSKAPIQRLADRVAEVFVPLVLVVAAFTFVIWFVAGPEPRLTLALTSFIAVLVIACPCAMGLATPTAIMVGTGRGAEAGILIRGGEALEIAQRVDTVVLDKTGTLTAGRPSVGGIVDGAGRHDRRAARHGRIGREGERAPGRGGDPRPGTRGRARLPAGRWLPSHRRPRRRGDRRRDQDPRRHRPPAARPWHRPRPARVRGRAGRRAGHDAGLGGRRGTGCSGSFP